MDIKKAVIKKAVKDYFGDIFGEKKAEQLTNKLLEEEENSANQDTEIPITGEDEETKTPKDIEQDEPTEEENQETETSALDELLDEANEVLGDVAEKSEKKAEESEFGTGLSGLEEKISEMEEDAGMDNSTDTEGTDQSVDVDIEGELDTLMGEGSEDEEEDES